MPIDSLPFVMMRGGTSKGIFLKASDVPTDRDALTALLLDVFGSPDRRQIDGLGGADKLTSKAAIIGPPVRPGTDLTYLFGQVGTVRGEVDYRLNCGNLTAAVGMYAIEEGFVAAVEGRTVVRVHNVNTDRVIRVEVPVVDGRPAWRGDLAIGGVPGTGAAMSLDFSSALGAITGSLLPTGRTRDLLDVPGLGPVEMSIVDGANLAVYVEAATLGMRGIESPDEIDADSGLKTRMDAIRAVVAERCGLGAYWRSRQAPSTPMLLVVSPPADYRTCTQGDLVPAASIDCTIRQFASGSASKTLAGTLAATSGVACALPDSLPHRIVRTPRQAGVVSFGHPSGVLHVEAEVDARDPLAPQVRRLAVQRTARRIAEGRVFLKRPLD